MIALDGEVHILSIVQIRLLANGSEYCGDADLMIQLLARVLMDEMDGN